MYNDNTIIRKWEVINPITDAMIPVDFCQNSKYETNFTTDDMVSKSEAFSNHKLDIFDLTESSRPEWIQVIDKYWYGEITSYYSYFDLFTQCLCLI